MPTVAEFMTAVRSLVGTPVEYRGRTVKGIDCSGLIHTALGLCGITGLPFPHYGNMPRTIDLEAPLNTIAKRSNTLVQGSVVQIFRGSEARHMGVFDSWKDGFPLWIHACPKNRKTVLDVLPLNKIYMIWNLNAVAY